ncbi:MAG: hypothetical protein QOJ00_694 [Actinomycetota bacterium]
MSRIPLATASAPPIGHVDENGYVWLPDGTRLEWWVLGDDGWHAPRAAASLRQRAIERSPLVETTIRVPGGDVAWRVGAVVTGTGAVVVAECENRGSIPVAVGVARVEGDAVVSLDEHPVVHTVTWRGAIEGASAAPLPDLATVARGWDALAGRGAQITTNAPTLDDALAIARVSLLLHHGDLVAAGKRAERATAAAVATALTLLGYEDEAGTLRAAARLKPPRKGLPVVSDMSAPIDAATGDAVALLDSALLAARTVIGIRGAIVNDTTTVDCLSGYAPSWRGRSVDVSHVPTNHGELSYAVRWHGDKPALLWEVLDAKRMTITAGALDPAWSTTATSGEALLATPPT